MKKVEIKKINDISDFESNINTFKNYKINTPYQYYGWLRESFIENKKNYLKKYYRNIIVACLYDNFEMIGLAILIIKKVKGKKSILFLGFDTASDYLDFLWKDSINTNDVEFFLNEIMRKTNCNQFYFSGLRTESITYNCLIKLKNFQLFQEEKCVKILINQSTYEDYIKSLRKSVRQNIRTANNRLSKDKKIGILKVYSNTSRELAKELQQIYEKRREIQNKDRKDLKYRLYKVIRKIGLRFYNYLENSMLLNNDSFVVVYEIDNEIAAFGHALKDGNNNLYFMQVSFNDKYKRYSPGVLMFTELINRIIKKNEKIVLDLTVGTEKYKYDLGGISHTVVSGVYKI